MLSADKEIPPPLNTTDYPQVHFWLVKSFDLYCKSLAGETDGLATQQKRRGRRPMSESNEDRHPYLENKDGSAISRDVLIKVGHKAWRLWRSMNAHGLAPTSWGKASEDAYIYFNSEMLNEPEFEFYRYCKSNWKLSRWATKAYASWAHNHLKSNETGNHKAIRTAKRKHSLIDNPSLLQIDDDESDNLANTFIPHMLSASTSVIVQVCTHQL